MGGFHGKNQKTNKAGPSRLGVPLSRAIGLGRTTGSLPATPTAMGPWNDEFSTATKYGCTLFDSILPIALARGSAVFHNRSYDDNAEFDSSQCAG